MIKPPCSRLMAIKSYLSLKFCCHCFIDAVSGEDVNMYIDRYGDRYMKTSKWSLFYVKLGQK